MVDIPRSYTGGMRGRHPFRAVQLDDLVARVDVALGVGVLSLWM
jgi:hypothetical protein